MQEYTAVTIAENALGYWSETKRGALDQRQWGAWKNLLDIVFQVLAIAAGSPGRGRTGKGPALNMWMSSSGSLWLCPCSRCGNPLGFLTQKARLCQQLAGAARSFSLVTFFALGIWGSVRIFGCSSRRWRVMGSVQSCRLSLLEKYCDSSCEGEGDVVCTYALPGIIKFW